MRFYRHLASTHFPQKSPAQRQMERKIVETGQPQCGDYGITNPLKLVIPVSTIKKIKEG